MADGAGEPDDVATQDQSAAPVEPPAVDTPRADAPGDPAVELLGPTPPEAVASPDWIPELELEGDPESAQLMKLAAASERKQQWDAGPNNALALYARILQQDAQHAAAARAIERLLPGVQDRLRGAVASQDWSEARRLLGVLRHVRPEDAETLALTLWLEEQESVAELMADADALTRKGRLLPPVEPNATTLYRQVLASSPEHPGALAGLAEVERAILGDAVQAADAGRFRDADRLLADAANVQPGSEAVQNASARIMVERTRRTELLIQEAQKALARLEFATVERLLGEMDAISAQTSGVDDLRSRLEVARIYGLLSPGQTFSDPLVDGRRGPEMRVLPIGELLMGSPEGEPGRAKNEGPRHPVRLNLPFALAVTEVSVAAFQAFIDQSGYRTQADDVGASTIYDERTGRMLERKRINWRYDHAGGKAALDLPVVHVSWNDAHAYAAWLAAQTGRPYRLPTEAEFEYALRAGSTSRYAWGDEEPARTLGNFAGSEDRSASGRNWVKSFAGYADGFWGPAPTGSFPRNAFGLFDLEGNVSEWVEDCWHESYRRAPVDGSAWVNPGCTQRVGRGASWASAPDQVRSANRLKLAPDTTNARLGFRVALTLDVPRP